MLIEKREIMGLAQAFINGVSNGLPLRFGKSKISAINFWSDGKIYRETFQIWVEIGV